MTLGPADAWTLGRVDSIQNKFILSPMQKVKKKEAIVPFDEWERTEKAKEILEHVYLHGIIKERGDSKPTIKLDDLLKAEGMTLAELES